MSFFVERNWLYLLHSILRIKYVMQGKAQLKVCLVYMFSGQYILAIVTARDIFPEFTLKGVQEIRCLFVCFVK